MRNLSLTRCRFARDESLELSSVNWWCWNSERRVWLMSRDHFILQMDSKSSSFTATVLFSLDSNQDFRESSKRVISLFVLDECDSLCVACEDGVLLSCCVSSGRVETIGCVGTGFSCAAWSPDGDVFLLVTGHDTLILMTRQFEPIGEFSLFGQDFGQNKPVSIGWGKEETQFRGSGPKEKENIDANETIQSVLSASDDGKPRVTWRGDGQLFAVNAVSPRTGVRNVLIFSREGSLECTSESLPGLEALLCWRPVGNVMAAVQRLPHKYRIVFIEKNGLSHGELVVSFGSSTHLSIRQMEWNCDSSVLAVRTENYADPSESEISLYTSSNYHWYLKQKLRLPTGKCFNWMSWNPEKPLILCCATNNDEFLEYTWNWTIDRSFGARERDDDALIAVIDADKVLLTPFGKVVVPPPMAASELLFVCSVNQICFPRNHSNDQMAAILSDDRIAFAVLGTKNLSAQNSAESFGNASSICKILKIINENDDDSLKVPLCLHHWLWLSPTTFLAVRNDVIGTVILQYRVDEEKKELMFEQEISISGLVETVSSSDLHSTAAVIQLSCGKLLKCSLEDDRLSCCEHDDFVRFPRPCHSVQSCCVDGREFHFGLSEGRLYCSDKELCRNCTSFALHDDFLLMTTSDHNLVCVPLLWCCSDVNENKREIVRKVERGSRIVTCVRNGIQVILQMPRGNLEAIHPRPLVLNVVAKWLDAGNFYEAFVLLRKHRINTNLLVDHNWQNFLNNVNNFVSQIDNVNWLNVFLTDLEEDDVTFSLYSVLYDLNSKTKMTNKVNVIHSSVREALIASDCKKFLLPILTTYVMSKPPDLEKALNLVKTLDKKAKDEALNYLQYLVDINDLYDIALGTYDFELVLMIAQKSQKDPKEYLAFLNDLRKMELNYQRFSIDCYLKRPDKALQHIVECGEKYFDECLAHVKSHQLYRSAFKLVNPNSDNYRAIAQAYAEHLFSIKKYDEAAIWYERAENKRCAVYAFEKCADWKCALALAVEANLVDDERSSLAKRLAERLKSEIRHAEAAFVLEHYGCDTDEAISTLIDGHQWEAAVEMIYRHDRKYVIGDRLEEAVREHCCLLNNTACDLRAKMQKYVDRLQTLRNEKLMSQIQTENCTDAAIIDLASEIGSTVADSSISTQSNISRQSSRSRRKQERKKQSLKKGNPYEEDALVAVLAELMVQTDKMKDEFASTLRMALRLRFDSKAQELQQKFDELLRFIANNRENIWPTNVQTVAGKRMEMFGPNSTSNSIVAAMKEAQNESSAQTTDSAQTMPPKLRDNVIWQLDVFS